MSLFCKCPEEVSGDMLFGGDELLAGGLARIRDPRCNSIYA